MILLHNLAPYIPLIAVANFRWDKGGGGETLLAPANLLRTETGLNKVMNAGGTKAK